MLTYLYHPESDSYDFMATSDYETVMAGSSSADLAMCTVISKQEYDNGVDALNWRRLRQCLGYVENGSQSSVTIGQDDATKAWHMDVGKASYWDEDLSKLLTKVSFIHTGE